MSDEWEQKHGLNPDNPSDRNGKNLSSEGYTNVEMYLNELAGDPVVYASVGINNEQIHPVEEMSGPSLCNKIVPVKIYNLQGKIIKIKNNMTPVNISGTVRVAQKKLSIPLRGGGSNRN